ncbi:MAG: hypothetical protein M3545_17705 [Acidobacteriota bacterium]|nr:hypothetical protein [Acidobacteriota bacterium]
MNLWQTAPEFQTGATTRHPALQGTERSGDEWHIEPIPLNGIRLQRIDHPASRRGPAVDSLARS